MVVLRVVFLPARPRPSQKRHYNFSCTSQTFVTQRQAFCLFEEVYKMHIKMRQLLHVEHCYVDTSCTDELSEMTVNLYRINSVNPLLRMA